MRPPITVSGPKAVSYTHLDVYKRQVLEIVVHILHVGLLVGACQWLLGRGVADDKGPMVATLYALKFLKEQGYELRYPGLLYTSSTCKRSA